MQTRRGCERNWGHTFEDGFAVPHHSDMLGLVHDSIGNPTTGDLDRLLGLELDLEQL